MKKALLLTALAGALALGQNAWAQSGPQGGYTGPGGPMATTAEAAQLADDAPVTLVGKLESQIDDDEYVLRDGAGTMVVEIKGRAWNGLTVGPEDTVELAGRVDRDRKKAKVEIYRVTKK